MQTPYDWITVAIFAGLVTHFLSQSTGTEENNISLWHYLVPSVGCALANWLGNEGADLAAVALIAAVLMYILRYILRQAGAPPGK